MICLGAKEINNVKLGVELPTSEPLDTSQNKTAGAGYSSGDLNWNGDYSTARIKTIKGNENVGLQQGDQWMTLYVKLTDGTTISDRWGNGNVNVTYNRTTNSGISYSIHVDSHNVTYTFAEEVKATQIYMSAYTMYGTWRSEGFNINLYVSGNIALENAKEIVSVMLGNKEIFGGVPQQVSGTFSDTSGVKLTLELKFKGKAFVRTTTKSTGVSSVLSHDVYLEYSDDNSNWIKVCEYHTQYWTNAKCYSISNTKHKYWRVRFNGGNNQGNQEVILGNEKAMNEIDFTDYTKIDSID